MADLATFHRVAPRGSGRTALMAALAKALAEPARIKSQWASLSPSQRALAEAILQRGDRAALRTLREQPRPPGP